MSADACTACGKLPSTVFVTIKISEDFAICSECVEVCAKIIGEKWSQTASHIASFKREDDPA